MKVGVKVVILVRVVRLVEEGMNYQSLNKKWLILKSQEKDPRMRLR